jgi:SnoaL-like domain
MQARTLVLALSAPLVACASAAPPAAPCASSTSAPVAAKDDAKDILAIREIEVVFHDAGSTKDLEKMMSLFTEDAELTSGGKTYKGKADVRHYFADVAPPFQPSAHMIAYTPAQRIRTTRDGDKGTIYFECLWLDTTAQSIAAHTFSDDTLVRSGGRWLVKTMKAGPVPGL